MTNRLTDTLDGLKSNPTLVIELYEQIYNSELFALINKGSEGLSFDNMQLPLYDASDGIKEFFLFTEEKLVPANLLKQHLTIKVSGQTFWAKTYLMMTKIKFQVAINPIGISGIRLNKEMVLGMLGQFGNINSPFLDVLETTSPKDKK